MPFGQEKVFLDEKFKRKVGVIKYSKPEQEYVSRMYEREV